MKPPSPEQGQFHIAIADPFKTSVFSARVQELTRFLLNETLEIWTEAIEENLEHSTHQCDNSKFSKFLSPFENSF